MSHLVHYPPVETASTQERPIQLLLRLLHCTQDDSTDQIIHQLIDRGIDWDVFMDAVFEHRVLPLIYRQVQENYIHLFPEDIRQELADEYFENTTRNIALSKRLLAAIALLQTHNIPAVAFKGPTLAIEAYGDLSLRMFSDLDLLVPGDRFLDAKTILLNAGYHSGTAALFLVTSAEQENQLICELGECSLYTTNPAVQLDLHQRLIAGDFFQLAHALDQEIWQQPHTSLLLKQPIQTMAPEDLLLYLCIHGTKDLWKRLSWLCDVAAMLPPPKKQQPSTIHWDLFFDKARRHHLEPIVWLGLTLAHTVLGVPIPSEVQRLPVQPKHYRLVNEVLMRLSHPVPQNNQSFNLIKRFQFRFQVLDSSKDKQRCLQAFYKSLTQPTSADIAFICLSPPLYGLYRIIRPFRLLKESVLPSGEPKNAH